MKRILILPLLVLCVALVDSSCSSGRHRGVSRSPDSIEDEPPIPREDIADELERIQDAQIYGSVLLREFDGALEDKARSRMIFSSRAYARLRAVRVLKERAERRLARAYRLGGGSEVRAQILGRIEKPPGDLDVQILAFEALASQIKSLRREPQAPSSDWRPLAAAQNRAEQKLAVTDWKQFLRSRTFLVDVNRLAEEVLAAEREFDREPTSLLQPSASAAGNVGGNKFRPNLWCLTFEGGPSLLHTRAVLQALKDHGLRATFFQLASRLDEVIAPGADPDLSSEFISGRMDVANHSYHHLELPITRASAWDRELRMSSDAQEAIYGNRPRLFRLPHGAGVSTPAVREAIAREGMIHVFWNVDTLDWQDRNPESIYKRAMAQMSTLGRGIILFHDIYPQSVEASRMLMGYLTSQPQIRVLTVQDAIDEINTAAQQSQ